MNEIAVNHYNDSDVQNMLIWCQQNLRTGTWQMKFSSETTTFVFRNNQDSFLFVCRWPQ